jgi:hypothetical protein
LNEAQLWRSGGKDHGESNAWVIREPLNRGLPVTDKWLVAWQNLATQITTG